MTRLLLPLLAVTAALAALPHPVRAQAPDRLPGTRPLPAAGDPAARMVDGIQTYLLRETAASSRTREGAWKRAAADWGAHEQDLLPRRDRLRRMLGIVDPRSPDPVLHRYGRPSGAAYRVEQVRWPVFDAPGALWGEGLLLTPVSGRRGAAVVLPDADWTPEQCLGQLPGVPGHLQWPRILAENGVTVLVPVLVDRSDRLSGHPAVRFTNQPHREFLYRAGFEMGRHLLGYEAQIVLAGLEALRKEPIGGRVLLAGYGEGGLLALYLGALEPSFSTVLVGGAFGGLTDTWRQPIYRNVFGLLTEFSDAELAAMVQPRLLLIHDEPPPSVQGPPPVREGRSGAAPGRLEPLRGADAALELLHTRLAPLQPNVERAPAGEEGARKLLERVVLREIGRRDPFRWIEPRRFEHELASSPRDRRKERLFGEILEHTQVLLRQSEQVRAQAFARLDASSPERWREAVRPLRARLWDQVIGRLPDPEPGYAVRSRRVYDEPRWTGYQVELDVWPATAPEVFAQGILLVPKGIPPGERRPVVVCQHGLEGRPEDVADPRKDHPAYHRYACRLADEGFVVFAPQNPYIGQDRFRVLQRLANPLGKSLFSVITAQHQRILEWLGSLPYVDRERIGFYGLSYGGKTAMRVPALLEGYCLSICSADFNEWIRKNVDASSRYSYLFTGEYEMPEWNLGHTFNYAEMAALICPRPFMVERGHDDGVAPDEWVAYEFAKVKRRYVKLGIGSRAEIEYFDGPHTIHGVGTFAFLKRHLRFPG